MKISLLTDTPKRKERTIMEERKCRHCGARYIYPLSTECSNGCGAGYVGDISDKRNKLNSKDRFELWWEEVGEKLIRTKGIGLKNIAEAGWVCGQVCEKKPKLVNQSECYHSFRHTPVDFPVYGCRKCGRLSK
jgi:hypothetical protein